MTEPRLHLDPESELGRLLFEYAMAWESVGKNETRPDSVFDAIESQADESKQALLRAIRQAGLDIADASSGGHGKERVVDEALGLKVEDG